MMMKNRILLLLLTFILIISFAACGNKGNADDNQNNGNEENIGSNEETDPNVTDSNVKKIYFLNYDEKLADEWQRIVTEYETETGVTVVVETPGSTAYDQALQTNFTATEPPVIIEIGSNGYRTWSSNLADLSNTTLYSHLSDQSLSLSGTGNDHGNYGIPYDVEGFGIIVNNAILQKYIALPEKATGITSIDEITNFATLKAVVEDMQANRGALGIDGVFASLSFAEGEDTRWTSHMASVPFYYEFQDADSENSTLTTGLASNNIEFSYGENLNGLFDLYLNNSISDKTQIENKTNADSIAEFALEKCAMIQHGSWIWDDIKAVNGNVVTEADLRMLPIYIGVEGEENQGLCIGVSRYLAINSQTDSELQQAGVNFLEWLFTSETGKDFVINDLGFNAPFDTFDDTNRPKDPLKREVNRWLRTDNNSVFWNSNRFPTGFSNQFRSNLIDYAKGESDWDAFTTNIKNA